MFKPRKLRLSLVSQILIAMIIGGSLGYFAGPSVSGLGNIGKIFIQLIKGMAVPLVFFAIIEALLTTHIPIRSGIHLLIIVSINASIAASIGLTLSNTIQPGSLLNIKYMPDGVSNPTLSVFAGKGLDLGQIVGGYLPESIAQPFADNNLIAVVILALFIGIALRRLMHEPLPIVSAEGLIRGFSLCFKVFEKILEALVKLVPLAVFGVMAKTVGEYGFAPFQGLFVYVAIGILGLLIQGFIVYPLWIKFIGNLSLKEFFREARAPILYAFGTNSSLATLPLTLHALDTLKVPKASSRLGACVGTNLNNDGILLYEAMAVLFVAQAHGLHIPFVEQVGVAFLCVIAAIGVAGIPEAGIVSLSLVLTTAGLPVEILPLLLTVDWLVARMRSVVNVMSDMTVSIALGKFHR